MPELSTRKGTLVTSEAHSQINGGCFKLTLQDLLFEYCLDSGT